MEPSKSNKPIFGVLVLFILFAGTRANSLCAFDFSWLLFVLGIRFPQCTFIIIAATTFYCHTTSRKALDGYDHGTLGLVGSTKASHMGLFEGKGRRSMQGLKGCLGIHLEYDLHPIHQIRWSAQGKSPHVFGWLLLWLIVGVCCGLTTPRTENDVGALGVPQTCGL